ncbi:MAG: hypothetical protein U0984_07205, partial [Prosthecobacter sp.]|nr:hypothetical protein [Prosthecobacter sp.]
RAAVHNQPPFPAMSPFPPGEHPSSNHEMLSQLQIGCIEWPVLLRPSTSLARPVSKSNKSPLLRESMLFSASTGFHDDHSAGLPTKEIKILPCHRVCLYLSAGNSFNIA